LEGAPIGLVCTKGKNEFGEIMTHRYSTLTDSEIDAIASTGLRRAVCLVLALMALLIFSGVASFVVEDEKLVAIARIVALLSSASLILFVHGPCSVPDELIRLQDDPRMLDQTLDLLKRSPAARQLRDEILASGRALRVFDYLDLTRAHEKALHEQKVQEMNGLASEAGG
jgi:hypothetical protein